jgi:hypothetical protein
MDCRNRNNNIILGHTDEPGRTHFPEDGVNIFACNVYGVLPDYPVSGPTRHHCRA